MEVSPVQHISETIGELDLDYPEGSEYSSYRV